MALETLDVTSQGLGGCALPEPRNGSRSGATWVFPELHVLCLSSGGRRGRWIVMAGGYMQMTLDGIRELMLVDEDEGVVDGLVTETSRQNKH